VVLIQEFNYMTNSAADITSLVTSVCGAECTYVRGPNAQIPNGVISRYPLISSGSWTDASVSNRTFVWAQIDVPGAVDLWAVSVHLLSTGSTDRETEAQQLVTLMNANVTSGDYLVLGGDFNTDDRTEAAIGTLDAVFHVAAPWPEDQAANSMTSTNRNKPYDWVVADAELEPRSIPTVIGLSSFAHGAVIDTRVYTPLSEISPAMLNDSGATSMQHMAVVRDFAFEP
jgi:endonuclease/exonuclease/phosphatase family metal-dependent hydrolase